MNATSRPAEVRINAERLWDSLMQMAKIGATPKGGVKRLTLTDLDRQARDLFVSWCKEAGLAVSAPPTAGNGLTRPLDGLEFVITGRLENLGRPEAEERIRQLGGAAKSDITRKTDYLVVGAEPGSKLARAESLGVKRIGEAELLAMLEKHEMKKGN